MFSSQNSQVSSDANYIEDVFSTYLYTGNGSATYNNQLIQNGLNLNADENLGRDFLIWTKARSSAENHRLYSPVAYKGLISNSTAAAVTPTGWINSATNGYYLSTNASSFDLNTSNVTYASWTFRKQPKFFDVVTYTGTGSNTTIAHNLASTPGCIIVKRTDTTANWQVYHSGVGSPAASAQLNLFAAPAGATTVWNSTAPTSTVFSVGTSTTVNASGGTYVAYLFASNAGGFGLTGTDNVITCGTVTGAGDTTYVPINLGYEAQWLLTKRLGSSGGWNFLDNMRGWVATANGNELSNACVSDAATTGEFFGGSPSATGVNFLGNSGVEYIYIAIRRGPMKVPTSGTSVFSPIARSGNGSVGVAVTGAGFPPDLVATKARNAGQNNLFADRLRGIAQLYPDATYSEGTNTNDVQSYDMDGMTLGSGNGVNGSGTTYINWLFRRAPSFFDEVCYTGGSSPPNTFAHNLGVAPELMIIKSRNNAYSWFVYSQAVGVAPHLRLNTTDAATTGTAYLSAAPDASNFYLNGTALCNNTGDTYVAYLFATCAGVSKVGSYTGTGTTLQVNCGFTGGARFVLIKRTDSTGSWYVWDVARGISSGNDPYLLLNSTAAEVTSTDYIDAYSAGFEISSTAPAEINASGGSFIFLAIS